jgi:Tetratricopeptide repeat
LFTDEAGRVATAIEQFRELLGDRLRLYGPDNADTLATRRRLAVLTGVRDPAAAVNDLGPLLADCLRVLGPDHPDTLRCRVMLAVWISNAGDPLTGVAALHEMVAHQVRVLGPDHLDTLRFRGYPRLPHRRGRRSQGSRRSAA